MNNNEIAETEHEIIRALGIDSEHPPVTISKFQLSEILSVKPGTTDVWASTGRHEIPFSKIGRQRRYRIKDIAIHLLKQRRTSTAQV